MANDEKSAIQEVRDQLFLDRADGRYLSRVSANLGFNRPQFGFSDDSKWRAIVRRCALDYRQIANVFEDIMTIWFGPRVTVATVLAADAFIGDTQITLQDVSRIPQRGTLVIDEGLVNEETVVYNYRDPKTGAVDLETALTFNHVFPSQNNVNYLSVDEAAASTVLQLEETQFFPSTGTLLISAGTSVEEVKELLSNDTTLNQLTIVAGGLTNNQIGPKATPISSAFSSFQSSQQIVFIDDSTNFPAEGLVNLQEDNAAGNPSETVRYIDNDITTGMLTLTTKLAGAYTTATATLMEPGASIALAQVQVKSVGWDIFETEQDVLKIYIPTNLSENRLIDASYLHEVIDAAASTLAANANIGDTTISITDASEFPDGGALTIDAGAETIGYGRIDRFEAHLNGDYLIGDTVLFVDEVKHFVDAGDETKDLIIGYGTGSAETIAWTSIDEETNAITLAAALASNHTSTPATGTITTVAKASLVDTEIFTIDDGINTPVVFEFDLPPNGVTAGRVAVDVSADTTADDVRDSIIKAINSLDEDTFLIYAENGGAATVSLYNKRFGIQGNVVITEAVVNAGFIVAGMTGGLDEGIINLNSPDIIHLSRAITVNHLATVAVDMFEDAYGGTDLAIGDPTVAAAVDEKRFQGPYIYDPSKRAPEQERTTLAENLAGPTTLVMTQKPGYTALEVDNAALFDTTGTFNVRVHKGVGVGEDLDVTGIQTRRSVTGVTIGAAGSIIGATTIPLTTTAAPFPASTGFRILVDKGAANEEILWCEGVLTGTTIRVNPPATKAHVNLETVEILADIVMLSEVTTVEHTGKVLWDQRLNLLFSDFSLNNRINLVEELRSYITVTSAANFTANGGYAKLNHGKEKVTVESRLAADYAAGAGVTMTVEDGSLFPTAYPYFIVVGPGAGRATNGDYGTERLSVTNVTGNIITYTGNNQFAHSKFEWVSYEPGDEEVLSYSSTTTGGPERLNFSTPIIISQQHNILENVVLANNLSVPNDTGTDYPFYLPSSWEERLQWLFDKVRAAGVKVIVIDDI